LYKYSKSIMEILLKLLSDAFKRGIKK